MPKRTGRPTRNGAEDSREAQNGNVQHDELQGGEVQRGDAQFPDASERLQCRVVSGTHPSLISESELNQQCEFRAQRRSGPGGQHRNKTSSGVFLVHRPTDVGAEATERRSQAKNREVALQRLRFVLAVAVRTASPIVPVDLASTEVSPSTPLLEAPLTFTPPSLETDLRAKYHRADLRLGERNPDRPAVLALLLNDLWVAGGQPSLLCEPWNSSTSKIIKVIRSHGPALQWVNQVRRHHARPPLH